MEAGSLTRERERTTGPSSAASRWGRARPQTPASEAIARAPFVPRPFASPPAYDPQDLVGKMVGDLVIERAVAEGGIGAVYAARDPAGGRPVAVKVLQRRHLGDPGIASRFEREIRYLRRIAHPNVASLLNHGRLPDGRRFFCMDLYEGATLGGIVRASGPLPLRRALTLIDQVLAGLGAMHDARVAHLDLQPDNVFVVRGLHGADWVKLLDLGFAHEPGVDTGDGVTPESPGSLVGTPTFMSPEQATRGRAITERSDLFAAGLLLYFSLTGKLPFRGSSPLEVMVATVRSAPVPLRRERRNIPHRLEEILATALAKHPDARFASAAEMRKALAAISR